MSFVFEKLAAAFAGQQPSFHWPAFADSEQFVKIIKDLDRLRAGFERRRHGGGGAQHIDDDGAGGHIELETALAGFLAQVGDLIGGMIDEDFHGGLTRAGGWFLRVG